MCPVANSYSTKGTACFFNELVIFFADQCSAKDTQFLRDIDSNEYDNETKNEDWNARAQVSRAQWCKVYGWQEGITFKHLILLHLCASSACLGCEDFNLSVAPQVCAWVDIRLVEHLYGAHTVQFGRNISIRAHERRLETIPS